MEEYILPHAFSSSIFIKVLVTNENYIYLRYTIWCFDIHADSEIIAKIKLINICTTSQIYCFYFSVCGEST